MACTNARSIRQEVEQPKHQVPPWVGRSRVPKDLGQYLLLARNLVIQLGIYVFPCLTYHTVSDLCIPSTVVSISPLLSLHNLTSHDYFSPRAVPSRVSPTWARWVCAGDVAMQVTEFVQKFVVLRHVARLSRHIST